jgi:hypothetical protein
MAMALANGGTMTAVSVVAMAAGAGAGVAAQGLLELLKQLGVVMFSATGGSSDDGSSDDESDPPQRPRDLSNYDPTHEAKHLPDTPESTRLNRGDSVHLFNDRETLIRVRDTLLTSAREAVQYLGYRDNHHRWGMLFDRQIGIRVPKGGLANPSLPRQELFWGELKMKYTGSWHIIPST